MEFLFFILIVQSVIFGAFCSFIAGQKERGKFNWFWLGFFFSILALIALVAIPSIKKYESKNSSYPPSDRTSSKIKLQDKVCPFCAETIKSEAKICRYCKKDLPVISKPESVNLKNNNSPSSISNYDIEYCITTLNSLGCEVVNLASDRWDIINPSGQSKQSAYSINDLREITTWSLKYYKEND